MTLEAWLTQFGVTSLLSYWILGWGGAEWIEGWKSIFLISWFAHRWSAEQIKLYVLLLWIVCGVWFVVGLMHPEYRFAWF